MSIILNALKKSEAQRRLGKTPTLAETAAISSVPDTPGRLYRWWPVTALFVLVIAGWFGRDLVHWGSEHGASVAEPVAPGDAAGQLPDHGQQPGPDGTVLDDITEEAKAAFEQPVTTAPGTTTFSTPVESYIAPTAKPEATADTSSSAGGTNVESPTTHTDLTPEPGYSAGIAPLSIYEIPRDIRNSLPDIRITLQVFAKEPENRFAVVNGQRLLEGNELASGLVLVEVRKRGLVFSYRDYRFIVGN